MCYRCTACSVVVAPGQPLRRFVEYYDDSDGFHLSGNIRRETPVCESCLESLRQGMPMAIIQRRHSRPSLIVAGPKELRTAPKKLKKSKPIQTEQPATNTQSPAPKPATPVVLFGRTVSKKGIGDAT